MSSAKSTARLTPLISAPTCSLRGLICNFSSLCLLFLAFEFPPAVLEAPLTVKNFLQYVDEQHYDGTIFHRVIADFMVQGGDPEGTGRGGPGYKWADEKSALGIKHAVGSLSMANAGPNTNGSQFFITHIATDWLNGKHAVFGQVKSGKDVVDAVAQGDKLKSVTITEG